MVMAVLVTSILSSVFLRQKPRLVPWPNLKPVLWIFLAETLLGSFFFLYGLSHSPMVLGSTLTSLAPVLSVFVAVAMGLEKFSWHRLLGVVVVVSGLALLVAGR
jgi:drug/metabolite transporter (DMT)-like permease